MAVAPEHDTTVTPNDAPFRFAHEPNQDIGDDRRLRWFTLLSVVAVIAVLLSLLLLFTRWHQEQQERQKLFEQRVNLQVQALDQQLQRYDVLIGDFSRVMRQGHAATSAIFKDVTENWPQRFHDMQFVAFYRADDSGTLRLRDVTPADTLELRSGATLLRVVPTARSELWADARQWRSHFIVQSDELTTPRLNILYPVLSRDNQFDTAQFFGVLHLGIDLNEFIIASFKSDDKNTIRLQVANANDQNEVLFDSHPELTNTFKHREHYHAEFSLLTGGLNWQLRFFTLSDYPFSQFLWRYVGAVFALLSSTFWLIFGLWARRYFKQTQRKLAHAKRTLTHARELLHQTENELDNFSYCVSHDLRAPLRHIRSYSQILLLDHGAQLDSEGLTLSQRIADSGAKMSRLIDDLLRLSRVSRSPMKPVPCDLSELVSSVYVELRGEFSQTDVRFKCEPAINVVADPPLMRIAINCLLHNALKYSSKRVLADVQFGIDPHNTTEIVYFIRDNGVGFDMRYIDRLFAPFNRLHGEDDFGGTGIGLATAKRVILRHGGRIWGKSMPNEGTTMYFTLPPPLSRTLSGNETASLNDVEDGE